MHERVLADAHSCMCTRKRGIGEGVWNALELPFQGSCVGHPRKLQAQLLEQHRELTMLQQGLDAGKVHG